METETKDEPVKTGAKNGRANGKANGAFSRVIKKSATEKDLSVRKNGLTLRFDEDSFGKIQADKIAQVKKSDVLVNTWEEEDVEASLVRSKSLVAKCNDSFKILSDNWRALIKELQIAQVQFKNQGSIDGYTFEKFWTELGLKRTTVYRWIAIADPKADPPKNKKKKHTYAFVNKRMDDKKFKTFLRDSKAFQNELNTFVEKQYSTYKKAEKAKEVEENHKK